MHCLSCSVSPTSRTKRFFTIGCLVVQRASRMFRPGLGEGAGEVLEQAGAIPGVDLELHPVGGLVVAVPAHLGEPLRRLLQRGDVAAVRAVDRDPPPERDVADDLVARNRAAALGEAHHDVVDALDLDPEAGRLLGPAARVVGSLDQPLGRLLLDGLAPLQTLHHLVGDDLGRDLRLAEGDVEVVRLAEAHLADHVDQQRRSGELLVGQALLLERLRELVAALVLGVLAPLAREPGTDLVARAAGANQLQPVARGTTALLGGEHLDDVPALSW